MRPPVWISMRASHHNYVYCHGVRNAWWMPSNKDAITPGLKSGYTNRKHQGAVNSKPLDGLTHTQVGSLLGTMNYRLTRCHSPEKEGKKTAGQVGVWVRGLGESPSWPSILSLTQASWISTQQQPAEGKTNTLFNASFDCLLHKLISQISGATREARLCWGKAGDPAPPMVDDARVPGFKRIQCLDACVCVWAWECVSGCFFLSWIDSRCSGGRAATPYVIWNGVVWNGKSHGAR